MLRTTIIPALFIALSTFAWAATPDQVGTYAGTIKESVYASTTKPTKTKSDITIQIAADESTTVTVISVAQVTQAALINAQSAILSLSDPTTSGYVTHFLGFNFKGTSIKGTSSKATTVAPGGDLLTIAEGKLKLKKQ